MNGGLHSLQSSAQPSSTAVARRHFRDTGTERSSFLSLSIMVAATGDDDHKEAVADTCSSSDDDEPIVRRLQRKRAAAAIPAEVVTEAAQRQKQQQDDLEVRLLRAERRLDELQEAVVWTVIHGWCHDKAPMTVNAIAKHIEPIFGDLERAWLRGVVARHAQPIGRQKKVSPPA